VRRAAIAADDLNSFVLVLSADGYRVKVRYGPSGDSLGYAVARCGDRTAALEAVFYSGSRLARICRCLRSSVAGGMGR
jgi:hypothetical protein